MSLHLRYDSKYISERSEPIGRYTQRYGVVRFKYVHHTDYFDVFGNNANGCVPGTRRQLLAKAVEDGFEMRQLAPGGKIATAVMLDDNTRHWHNLLRDDRGPAQRMNIDLAPQVLGPNHIFAAGDVVYVHWEAAGDFPGGWYRAVVTY